MNMPKSKVEGMLTKREKDFCEEYVKDYNMFRAYLAAYPKCCDKTARSRASTLLKTDKIINYVHQLQDECVRISAINASKVIQQLDSIATDQSASKTDRLKALDLLSKTLGLQTQKVQVDNTISIKVGIDDEDTIISK